MVPCLARVWLEVGAFGYDSGSLEGRKETAVLCYHRNSPALIDRIMLDAQWVYVGLIVLGLLCVAVLFLAAISR